MKKMLSTIIITCIAILAISCLTYNAKAEFIPEKLAMFVGQQATLDHDYEHMTSFDAWKSTDSSIISVLEAYSDYCYVKALKPGKASVIFKCKYMQPALVWNELLKRYVNGYEILPGLKIVDITVYQHPVSISMQGSATIVVGDSYTLQTQLYPNDSLTTLTWNSDNLSVAKVDNGKVDALSVGSANITVTTSNHLSATCKVTVVKPETPVLTKVISLQYNSLQIFWEDNPKIDGYALYRKNDEGKWVLLKTLKKGVTSYVDSSVICGKAYTYTVKGYRMIGSSKINSDYNKKGIIGKSIPSIPVLNSFSNSKSTVLKWNEISGATKYEVYIKLDSDDFILLKTIKTTTLTDSIILYKDTVYYKVRAIRDESGNKVSGGYSKTISIKPQPIKMSISAKSLAYDRISITWKNVPEANGYQIYRSLTSSGTYTKIGDVSDGSKTSYINTGLETGISYFYKVRPYTSVSEKNVYGEFSNIVCEKPVPAAPSINWKSKAFDEIQITWQEVKGAGGYAVYRASSNNGDYTRLANVSVGSKLSFTDNGLTTGNQYYYKVRAFVKVNNNNVYGNYSSVVKAIPIPATPVLTARNSGFCKISLSWKALSGATGYKIYRASTRDGTYAKITDVTNGETTSYADSSITTEQDSYYYEIRALRKVGTLNVYSDYSSVAKANTIPDPPTLTVKLNDNKSVELSWTKVAGAKGYGVYVKLENLYDFKHSVLIEDGNTLTCICGFSDHPGVQRYKVYAYGDKGPSTSWDGGHCPGKDTTDFSNIVDVTIPNE